MVNKSTLFALFVVAFAFVILLHSLRPIVPKYTSDYRGKITYIIPTPTIVIVPTPEITTSQGWKTVTVSKSKMDNYCASYPSFLLSYPSEWDFKITPIKEAWGEERLITISNQYVALNIYQACTGGDPRIMFEDGPYAKRDPNDVMYGKFVEFLSSSKKIRYFLSTPNDVIEKYDEYVFSEELYNGTFTTHFIIGNITSKVVKSSSQQVFKEVEEIIKSIKPLNSLNNFSCPATDWVDCMPSPDSPVKSQCQPEFLQWAQVNCPNFKGAAL